MHFAAEADFKHRGPDRLCVTIGPDRGEGFFTSTTLSLAGHVPRQIGKSRMLNDGYDRSNSVSNFGETGHRRPTLLAQLQLCRTQSEIRKTIRARSPASITRTLSL
jgi:hypothetical protein